MDTVGVAYRNDTYNRIFFGNPGMRIRNTTALALQRISLRWDFNVITGFHSILKPVRNSIFWGITIHQQSGRTPNVEANVTGRTVISDFCCSAATLANNPAEFKACTTGLYFLKWVRSAPVKLIVPAFSH